MFFNILIALFSLMGLLVLHELGHFIVAKKCGVKVEEFGIGYPPRIIGKKFGETIYSLNLIPFGAFVKIYGEEGGVEDYRSFIDRPMYQRILIVLCGVISFWIISAILLSILFSLGIPTPVTDEAANVVKPKVQIAEIAKGSPAEQAGLEPLDIVRGISYQDNYLRSDKVKEIASFINEYKGKEITLTIQRWEETLEISLVPRISPPAGEGAMGVALTRTALVPFPWYEAPFRGIMATGSVTWSALQGIAGMFGNVIQEGELPPGASLMGPLGIFDFLKHAWQLGLNYFLYFVALISVFLAIFNLLPIPALDGGKLLFLIIELVRGKPVPQKVEQNITAFFFILLITLMIFVTIKFDIPRVF
jgi:regulator of sigma E protease